MIFKPFLVCLGVFVISIIIMIIYDYLRISHHDYQESTVNCDDTTTLLIPIEDRVDLDVDDRHNVHNSCLRRTASDIIHMLETSDQHIYSIDRTIQEINDMIELCPDTDLERLDNATYVLECVASMHSTYRSSFKIYELELIRLIWERINHPINLNVKDQLKSNLIDQLADCRNGQTSLHCCEGRIMRLLQTLEGCDKENIVGLRPMWAFKEEISNKIYSYRQKLLTKAPKIYSEMETKTDLTQKERDMMEKFNQCLIKNLQKRFEQDYLTKRLLTKNELNDITTPYYQSILEIYSEK